MSKRISIALGLFLTLTVAYTANSWDDKAEKGPNLKGVTCPISGKPVVADGTAKHNGGTVYFCCTKCPDAFGKNTAKYAAKANHQLARTGQAKQVKCGLKGKPVNKKLSLEIAGVKVGFCCGGCKGAAGRAEGDAQIELIFNDKTFNKGYEVGKKKDA